MSQYSKADRDELRERLSDARYNGESNQCNWCGAGGEKLSKTGSVRISDLKHKLRECSECGEITATYHWGGVVWRAAATTDDGGYTMVAGKS